MDFMECQSSKDACNSVKLFYSEEDYFMLKHIRKPSHNRISLLGNVKNSIAFYHLDLVNGTVHYIVNCS